MFHQQLNRRPKLNSAAPKRYGDVATPQQVDTAIIDEERASTTPGHAHRTEPGDRSCVSDANDPPNVMSSLASACVEPSETICGYCTRHFPRSETPHGTPKLRSRMVEGKRFLLCSRCQDYLKLRNGGKAVISPEGHLSIIRADGRVVPKEIGALSRRSKLSEEQKKLRVATPCSYCQRLFPDWQQYRPFSVGGKKFLLCYRCIGHTKKRGGTAMISPEGQLCIIKADGKVLEKEILSLDEISRLEREVLSLKHALREKLEEKGLLSLVPQTHPIDSEAAQLLACKRVTPAASNKSVFSAAPESLRPPRTRAPSVKKLDIIADEDLPGQAAPSSAAKPELDSVPKQPKQQRLPKRPKRTSRRDLGEDSTEENPKRRKPPNSLSSLHVSASTVSAPSGRSQKAAPTSPSFLPPTELKTEADTGKELENLCDYCKRSFALRKQLRRVLVEGNDFLLCCRCRGLFKTPGTGRALVTSKGQLCILKADGTLFSKELNLDRLGRLKEELGDLKKVEEYVNRTKEAIASEEAQLLGEQCARRKAESLLAEAKASEASSQAKKLEMNQLLKAARSENTRLESLLHKTSLKCASEKEQLQLQLSFQRNLLEENVKRWEENMQCKVCLDRPVGVVCLPCGHACLCKACEGELPRNNNKKRNRNCPICRKSVTKTAAFFL